MFSKHFIVCAINQLQYIQKKFKKWEKCVPQNFTEISKLDIPVLGIFTFRHWWEICSKITMVPFFRKITFVLFVIWSSKFFLMFRQTKYDFHPLYQFAGMYLTPAYPICKGLNVNFSLFTWNNKRSFFNNITLMMKTDFIMRIRNEENHVRSRIAFNILS